MKRLRLVLLGLATLVSACNEPPHIASKTDVDHTSTPVSSMVVRFKEGVHYRVLKAPFPVPEPELRSFFSYACPHCYVMKDVVDRVRTQHHVYVYESHVPFLRAMDRQSQDRLTAGLQVARKFNVSHLFSNQVFKAFHKDKIRAFSDDVVCSMLSSVINQSQIKSKALFDAAMASPEIQDDTRIASMLLETKQIPGVPVFVVDGKYLIETNKLSKTDLATDLAEITQFLQNNRK